LNAPGQLSIFLDSPEAAFAPANLNPTASFKLTLLNQKTPGQGDYFKGVTWQHEQRAAAGAAEDSMLVLAVC
jgi:hypothetical protein